MSYGPFSRNGVPVGLASIAGLGKPRVDTYVGPLNSYTTGLWSAAAVNRLLTSYTGPLLRVRRSSDNAEQDIGYLVNGALNTTVLASFVGSDSAFVTRWYDQSGAGNDFIQSTAASQPRLVNAGVYDGKLVFNPTGSDDRMLTTATGSSSVASKSIFRKANLRAFTTSTVEYNYGDTAYPGAGGAKQFQLAQAAAPDRNQLYITSNGGNGYYVSIYNSTTRTTSVSGIIHTIDAASATNRFKWYQGGVLQTQTFATTVGTLGLTGNFPAKIWAIGGTGYNTTQGAELDQWSCVIYDADKSADANAINTALA